MAAGAAALAALIIIGNVAKLRMGTRDPGLTTESALLLMYAVGAYLVDGYVSVAVAIGGGLAVLLSWKEPLHGFVQKMGAADLKAIMQFVLITLVILPVLPDENYGPYLAFNPHRIWLMVTLIVGISLLGYVAYKMFGEKTGTLLGGVLGGLISSTATTVSYARRARSSPDTTLLGASVILIASTIVFGRMIAEIAVVAPGILSATVPPLLAVGLWMGVLSTGLFLWARHKPAAMPDHGNPAELGSALIFGALYALITFAIAAARDLVGTEGLYGVAIISGLHDVDAITLSTAQMVSNGHVEASTGWRVILTAAMSNMVLKSALAGILGQQRLFRWVALWSGIGFAGALLVLLFWPG